MAWHEIWHVLVLTTTLLGAAGGAVLLLAPVVFDAYPEGLRRIRPLFMALIVVALLLLAIEWLIVHGD